MTSFLAAATGLAQDSRPDGPPGLRWVLLAVVVIVGPWIVYKLHKHGYFTKRR
ncbi:hypothetical protein ACIREE_26610 [Streptomyces sp. NPDC102467]|uniref:hypothetical protein n=1 Tax=Streptomyces sp. NPDC102467 TaxID=3366179 RepID=UPI00382DA770